MTGSGSSPDLVVRLLDDWRRGDVGALDGLVVHLQAELRRLAHAYMRRENPGHTLQTTALINELYVRLAGQHRANWQSRTQFVGIAAQLMRRILVDDARSRHYAKRGGGRRPLPLDEAAVVSPERGADLLALDEALERLAAIDARKARVIELRYFGGLTAQETANVIGVSPVTVTRDWNFAKAWLRRELTS